MTQFTILHRGVPLGTALTVPTDVPAQRRVPPRNARGYILPPNAW